MAFPTYARLGLLALPLVLSFACTQYKPQGALSSLGKTPVGLVSAPCIGKKQIFRIVEGSAISWRLETIGKDGQGSHIGSKHAATGQLETIRGLLANSVGLVSFNMQELATGDVKRDRQLREILFTDKKVETFRMLLEKIDTKESLIGAGNSKNLRMVGIVEIGGRKAQVIFPSVVSEKDGIYTMKGSVEITTRDSRPAINSISIQDRIETLESTLDEVFSNTIRLDLDLNLKNDCTP